MVVMHPCVMRSFSWMTCAARVWKNPLFVRICSCARPTASQYKCTQSQVSTNAGEEPQVSTNAVVKKRGKGWRAAMSVTAGLLKNEHTHTNTHTHTRTHTHTHLDHRCQAVCCAGSSRHDMSSWGHTHTHKHTHTHTHAHTHTP